MSTAHLATRVYYCSQHGIELSTLSGICSFDDNQWLQSRLPSFSSIEKHVIPSLLSMLWLLKINREKIYDSRPNFNGVVVKCRLFPLSKLMSLSDSRAISGTSYDITTIGTSICLVMRCLLLMLWLSKSGVFLSYEQCLCFDNFYLHKYVSYRNIKHTII